jgi:hypothetical protein
VLSKWDGILIASNLKLVSTTVSGAMHGMVDTADQGIRIFTMIGIKSNTFTRRLITNIT